MYNIHNHYSNIYSLAKSIAKNPQLIYLHPFGASGIENLEMLSRITSDPFDVSLICYDQEPIISSYNHDLFTHILYNSSWSKHRVLLNTELDSDEKDTLLEAFGLVDCYYFHHAFAASDWFRGYQYLTDLTLPKNRKLTKKFITFNRITSNVRVYRGLLVSSFIENDILQHGHVSFSKTCPAGLQFVDEIQKYQGVLGIPDTLVESAIRNITNLPTELRIDSVGQIPNSSFHINAVTENMESFVHLVTETCFWGRKKHLTEKIFKPIVMRQPFILAGCAHNLEYLKSYGFKTFDRWWDESYDHIENDIDRLAAIGELMADLCKHDLPTLTDMLHDMDEVLEYNYKWFYSKEFMDLIWNELHHNLHKAITHDGLPHSP